jgi:phosphatidylethanolamine-binding protein (PEBP) family uncharacterized protein
MIEAASIRRRARPALALVAVTVLAGCGESGSKSTAQQSSQSTGTSPAASNRSAGAASSSGIGSDGTSTSGTGAGTASSPAARHATSHAGGPVIRRRHRAHLVLPGPNSRPAPKLSAAQRANVSVADITLSSPGITQAGGRGQPVVARRYTCQGADTPPPLQWTGVPEGTKEFALFLLSTRPVHGRLFFDWAVAGLPGNLRALAGSGLPAGAIVGQNGFGRDGYSLCPAGGRPETYLFALYALPQKLSATTGFDPASVRTQAIGLAHHTGILFGTYG